MDKKRYMPIIHMPESIYNAVIRHAKISYPEESCGLFSGYSPAPDSVIITAYAASKNLAAYPCSNFLIDPVTHIQLQKSARIAGERIVGIYHSHPNGSALPSETDKNNASKGDFFWMIIAAEDIRCYLTLPAGYNFLEATLQITPSPE